MDSFSKATLTRSSTVWNYCTRILFPFRVFRERDEGDTFGYFSLKVVSMWFLVISLFVLVPCSYGNTLPVSAPAHYSNDWSPKPDSINNNNYNIQDYRSGSVVSIPTYPVRRQHYANQIPATNNDHNQPQKEVSFLPEPKPRHDELKEKLGFSLPSLSSLLPTSILNLPQQTSDSENQIETDGSNNSPYLDDSEFRQNPLQNQGENNNPTFTSEDQPQQQEQQNFEEADPSDSDSASSDTSPSLLSRIRNVLPFGNGFLSGLLNNPNSNVEGEENGESNTNDAANNNQHSDTSNDSQSSLDPSQVSITNEGDLDSAISESGDSSSIFPNPFRAMLNLLNLRPPALSDNKQSLDAPDPLSSLGSLGLSNPLSSLGSLSASNPNPLGSLGSLGASNPNPLGSLGLLGAPSSLGSLSSLGASNPLGSLGGDGNGDSPITALQSLADGGGGGVVGIAMSLFSTVASTIGITSANATWFILLGLALVPVIATAIAASVIAIVYASIYIPAAAIRNEGLDGEFYLLTLKRLSEILGIPDPFEELFGFRSYNGRALLRENASRKRAFLAGTVHESDECLERALCEVIGRKLMGTEERKTSWIGKGIKWVSEKTKHNNYLRSYSPTSSLQIFSSLLEAISTGMSSSSSTESRPKRDTPSTSTTEPGFDSISSTSNPIKLDTNNTSQNSCRKYVCDPYKSLRTFLTKHKLNTTTFKPPTER